MNEHERFEKDFEDVVQRLIADRPRMEPVDLDRIKLRALGRGTSHSFVPGPVRRRLLAPIMTMGLMGGGTGAVLAATDGGVSAAAKAPKPQCVQYDSHGQPKIDKKTGQPVMKTCKPPKPPKK